MDVVKTFFSFFALSLFVFTHAHAEKDLNAVLIGTYAINENWACPGHLAASGVISFDGLGNAEGIGNASGGGGVVPYECTWQYDVFGDPASCMSSGPNPVICDLKYTGACDVDGISDVLPDQVWYGNIGHKGNGFTGNGNMTDVILIFRQDGAEETNTEIGVFICGKTGTLVKISDFPVDLVPGFPEE